MRSSLTRPTTTDGIGGAGRRAAVSIGAVVGLLAGFVGGLVFGCAVGSAATFVVLRRGARQGRTRAPAGSVGRQLPGALDLLAACLAAGAALAPALAAVGEAFDGEVGDMLSAVARLSVLGAPVEAAWANCLSDPRWAPIARAVIRAHHSGAALTDVLVHLADDRRRTLRTDAQAAAERAGIAIVLPLGACFLPAFVLVGVVPVVAGFAHALWS
ncbi:MAG TPA: type II secretion system F family protein [Acidothermaceae bacterium]